MSGLVARELSGFLMVFPHPGLLSGRRKAHETDTLATGDPTDCKEHINCPVL